MYRYKRVEPTIADGAESTEVILTGLAQPKRHVHALICEQIASVRFRAYLNQDQIIDVDSDIIGGYPDPRWLVNLDLQPGDELSVGGLNSSGGSVTPAIIAEYEET